ncbi:glycosyltransferase [Rossellomorea vietnamensis]|uniref:Glycosyltransferase n=1 Tax=Rossellomorea vietnamensis TaxID=218284 RepID=A0A5D4K788_9BACI|nr:glycosyltransferase [Rossellomorea vietnamensis]TYR72625.1 glycosyltransferase [Rossellomorea vietnamensis]
MKILYLAAVDENENKDIGVINKINGQIAAFESLNINVDKLFYNSHQMFFNGELFYSFNTHYNRRIFMYERILKDLKVGSYQGVYIRYTSSDPFFVSFLKKLKGLRKKVIIELPTYPYDRERESTKLTTKISNITDKIYRNLLKSHVDNIVTFMNYDYIWGIPVIKLQNGISIEQIDFTGYTNSKNYLSLIAVANVSKWHGYDRLLNGMVDYYRSNPKRKVIFNLVGDGDEIDNLKEIVIKHNLQDKVVFHGAKSGRDLTGIFKKSHMAVGSLGMHRIGIEQGSTLKAKEYTARGLPFILGYQDTSFSQKDKFIYYISNNETSINIDNIISFYDNLKVESNEIRALAEQNFTWNKQLIKVKEALKTTL